MSLIIATLCLFMVSSTVLSDSFTISKALSYANLNNFCMEDPQNITEWKTSPNINQLKQQKKISEEECTAMNVTESCYTDCIWYIDPSLWILLIIENTTESLETLTRMINFYSMSASNYDHQNVGNPDLCLLHNGTYCYTPAVLQQYVLMAHGCCVPGTCVGDDAINILHANPDCYAIYSQQYGPLINDICTPMKREWNAGPIIVISIFLLFLSLVLIATVLKLYQYENQFICTFNMMDSWKSLMKLRANNQYNFLDGIRVWSIIWVIYAHSFVFLSLWSSNSQVFLPSNNEYNPNFKYFVNYFYTIFAQYGFYSVDSFFWLSGFLGTFSIYRKLPPQSNNNKYKMYVLMPLISIISRILRIAPMMWFVTSIEWQLADQLPYGHQVLSRRKYTETCSSQWYKIFFFYDNLVSTDGDDGCMSILWYIQADMQMFLVLPFLLLAFRYNKYIGVLSSCLLIVLCFIFRVFYAFYYGYVANLSYPAFEPKNGGDYKDDPPYVKPWIRMAPYFIGVLTMFVFIILDEKYKKNGYMVSKKIYFILLSLALFIISCLVFWPFQDVKNAPNDRWSLVANQIYFIFSRPVWGLALSLIAFTLKYKDNIQISLIKTILSFDVYQCVGKLTYCMYLVHFIVYSWWNDDILVPQYYSFWSGLLLVVGVVCIVTFISCILWLVMEKPCSNMSVLLIKYITNNNAKSKLIKKSVDGAHEYGALYEQEQTMKSTSNTGFELTETIKKN